MMSPGAGGNTFKQYVTLHVYLSLVKISHGRLTIKMTVERSVVTYSFIYNTRE